MKYFIYFSLFFTTLCNDQFEIKLFRGTLRPRSGERHITILTTSYNNKDWYRDNLNSIFVQKYSNYSLIYVDDCSPDKTGDLVEAYIRQVKPKCDVLLIKNKVRVTALLNLYRAIHLANPTDILATVDGDDWLPDKNVLARVNQFYACSNIWLTYGQFLVYPSNTIGFCCAYPNDIQVRHAYREYSHQPSHLRTFYAWLAQQIKLKDLLYEGKFYTITADLALTMPMMDMAGSRHKFVPEIMYIYNEDTPLNDHKIDGARQKLMADIIRRSDQYLLLKNSQETYRKNYSNERPGILIFSMNGPNKLCCLMESINRYVKQFSVKIVVYCAKNDEQRNAYLQLGKSSCGLKFIEIKQSDEAALNALLNLTSCKYIVLISDKFVFVDHVNLNECVRILEEIGAHSFCLTLAASDKSRPIGTDIGPGIIANSKENIFAWQFKYGQGWSASNEAVATLFRKSDLLALLKDFFRRQEEQFVVGCAGRIDSEIGVCYEKARVILS